MSFRIDDILKKETAQKQDVSETCDLHSSTAALPWQRLAVNDCNSILEQTLLSSRGYATHKQPCDVYSAKLYSSWYNCDKMYMPAHCDTYVEKGKSSFTLNEINLCAVMKIIEKRMTSLSKRIFS